MLLNMLYITFLTCFIIDYSGIIEELEKRINKILLNKKRNELNKIEKSKKRKGNNNSKNNNKSVSNENLNILNNFNNSLIFRFDKPLSCAMCMSWWLNLLYTLFTAGFSLKWIAISGLFSISSLIITRLIYLVRDIILKIINKIEILLKL